MTNDEGMLPARTHKQLKVVTISLRVPRDRDDAVCVRASEGVTTILDEKLKGDASKVRSSWQRVA